MVGESCVPLQCPVALRYSPTASQYSPTASQYRTPPESPTFSPEILFPNLDFVPIQETQEEFHRQLEEQYLELYTDDIAIIKEALDQDSIR